MFLKYEDKFDGSLLTVEVVLSNSMKYKGVMSREDLRQKCHLHILKMAENNKDELFDLFVIEGINYLDEIQLKNTRYGEVNYFSEIEPEIEPKFDLRIKSVKLFTMGTKEDRKEIKFSLNNCNTYEKLIEQLESL